MARGDEWDGGGGDDDNDDVSGSSRQFVSPIERIDFFEKRNGKAKAIFALDPEYEIPVRHAPAAALNSASLL